MNSLIINLSGFPGKPEKPLELFTPIWMKKRGTLQIPYIL